MPTLLTVRTQRFGDLQVSEEDRLRLLRPLAGFPETRHLLRLVLERQEPFVWLQSAEEPSVAFACAPCSWVRPGFVLEWPVWDRELWGEGSATEVLALVSFQKGPAANLAAPLVLEHGNRRALQVLNQAHGFGFAEPLLLQRG